MRSPRPRSPKSVREFINERIGVQARDESHKNEIEKLTNEKEREKAAAVEAAMVHCCNYNSNGRTP